MFFCNPCATKREWPQSMFKSRGKCEICNEIAVCNDIPSSNLPLPKNCVECGARRPTHTAECTVPGVLKSLNLDENGDPLPTPPPESKPTGPQPGDWVQVYGQVKNERPVSGRDDEDIAIEFFSIGEQFTVPIRRDRVIKCDPPGDIAQRCPHLAEFRLDVDTEYLMKRCTLHDGHAGDHTCRVGGEQRQWGSLSTVGYFEER